VAARAELPADATLADRYYLLASSRATASHGSSKPLPPPRPAVYHCAAQDRTGSCQPSCWGCSTYATRSSCRLRGHADQHRRHHRASDGVGRLPAMLNALPPDTLHARPETMSSSSSASTAVRFDAGVRACRRRVAEAVARLQPVVVVPRDRASGSGVTFQGRLHCAHRASRVLARRNAVAHDASQRTSSTHAAKSLRLRRRDA